MQVETTGSKGSPGWRQYGKRLEHHPNWKLHEVAIFAINQAEAAVNKAINELCQKQKFAINVRYNTLRDVKAEIVEVVEKSKALMKTDDTDGVLIKVEILKAKLANHHQLQRK